MNLDYCNLSGNLAVRLNKDTHTQDLLDQWKLMDVTLVIRHKEQSQTCVSEYPGDVSFIRLASELQIVIRRYDHCGRGRQTVREKYISTSRLASISKEVSCWALRIFIRGNFLGKNA